ncbi:hypothetical protein CEXT_28391 [Caerostris extrusa]|uniref:Uncharacterized protein n=1 Tax=Caerostris extrusa TaxID=172846 RepID=A0AAV4TGM4_CAEEX|nr:hypothetical protein CEXT_28391 [Caerostris extrusa]
MNDCMKEDEGLYKGGRMKDYMKEDEGLKRCVFPSHLADFRNNHSSLSSYAGIAIAGTNNNKRKMGWQLPGCSLK